MPSLGEAPVCPVMDVDDSAYLLTENEDDLSFSAG